jgi:hypothetical protein
MSLISRIPPNKKDRTRKLGYERSNYRIHTTIVWDAQK